MKIILACIAALALAGCATALPKTATMGATQYATGRPGWEPCLARAIELKGEWEAIAERGRAVNELVGVAPVRTEVASTLVDVTMFNQRSDAFLVMVKTQCAKTPEEYMDFEAKTGFSIKLQNQRQKVQMLGALSNYVR